MKVYEGDVSFFAWLTVFFQGCAIGWGIILAVIYATSITKPINMFTENDKEQYIRDIT